MPDLVLSTSWHYRAIATDIVYRPPLSPGQILSLWLFFAPSVPPPPSAAGQYYWCDDICTFFLF